MTDLLANPTEGAPGFAGMRHVVLGGVRIDLASRAVVFDYFCRALDSRRTVGVASANLDHLHYFGTGGAFQGALGKSDIAWLCLLDGAPLALRAAHLTGRRWPRLTGADLLPCVFQFASDGGWTVGVIGGRPQMHASLRRRLAMSHPLLRLTGCWSPTREEIEDPHSSAVLADRVRDSGVDIAVVCLGKPRQELWIERHGRQTGASILLPFGAAADFYSGVSQRAPALFRATGTEWLFRLATEPRRLSHRYLIQGPAAAVALMRS